VQGFGSIAAAYNILRTSTGGNRSCATETQVLVAIANGMRLSRCLQRSRFGRCTVWAALLLHACNECVGTFKRWQEKLQSRTGVQVLVAYLATAGSWAGCLKEYGASAPSFSLCLCITVSNMAVMLFLQQPLMWHCSASPPIHKCKAEHAALMLHKGSFAKAGAQQEMH
jgi:hypothetical protein